MARAAIAIAAVLLPLAGCGLREFENEFPSMSTNVSVTVYARRPPSWEELHAATAAWVRQLDHRAAGSATAILNETRNAAGRQRG